MRSRDFGAAPVWRATGDGDYSIPAGYRCLGFMAEGAGEVAFTSDGVTVTPDVEAKLPYAAQVDGFLASGTTATGIHAMLVKG